MKLPRLLRLALGLCASAAPAVLLAQASPPKSDPALSGDDTVVLPTFTVASDTIDRYRASDTLSSARVRTQLIETPSSISVLPRDFIDDIAPIRVYDAAKYIAGVQDGRGNSYLDRVFIRGFENTGRTINNFADAGSYNFDESLIERVEISKGPNAILSPGGSPGGTLNIVTKAPEFKAKRSFTALVGDFDAQKVTLDMTDALPGSERFAYRLIGAYQDTERYVSSSAKIRTKVIAPQFTWRISPTTELVTRYDYFETKTFREQAMILDSSSVGGTRDPRPGPGFGYKGLNGMPEWSYLSYYKHSLSTELSTTFNKYLSMRLAARFERFDEDSKRAVVQPPSFSNRYNPYTGILTPDKTWALADPSQPHDANLNPYVDTDSPFYDPTAVPLRATRAVDVWQETYAVQNDWVLNFELPYAKLQSVAGFAYAHRENASSGANGVLAPINLYDLANQNTTPTWNTTLASDNSGEATNWQLYLNQRVTFWEDRVALTAGVLHYDTETKSHNKISGVRSSLNESKDMFLGSALVRVTPAASLYYSYSTNATPATVNFNVLWREGKQREWGAKFEFFNRRLGLNIAYFELTQTNVAVPNPEYYAGDFSQPSDFLSNFGNHGTELEVTGALTRNLSIVGSITSLKMRDSVGNPLRSVADHLAAAMLNYRFSEGVLKGFSLSLGANYVSERAGDLPSPTYTKLGVPAQVSFYVPSHMRWNAAAGYEWGRFGLRLMVDNLTAKKDYFSGAGARYSEAGIASATGRNFRLAATVKF